MKTFLAISWLLCLALLTLAYDSPPSITTQPQDVSTDDRVPFVLTCAASGQPEPTYSWKKDGNPFELSDNDRARLDGGNLIIENPQTDDNGEYQCFANNVLGTAISDKVHATVAYLEKFKDSMPKTKTVDHGDSLTLRCGMDYGPPGGYPEPIIYWSDASAKPAPVEYDERVNQDLEGNLVFSNVNGSDAGGYYCQAVNNIVGASQRSPKVTLTVNTNVPALPRAANLLSSPPSAVLAIRTEELRLKCIAAGYPTPSIIWKRNNVELVETPESEENTARVIVKKQELTITSVVFDDAGEYECIATNSAGQDNAISVITVESAPYFSDPPSDETKGPGESVTIECQAQGVPPPTVEWLVNGQPYSDFAASYDVGDRWTVVTGDERSASIEITGLVTSDSNVFQCLASNKYKEKLTSVVLNVVSVPATITEFSPARVIVLQDSSAAFDCKFTGRPTPSIMWTFKGTQLVDGGKYSIDDVEGRLVINDVDTSDSGRYTCEVTNAIDGVDYHDDADGSLDVLAKTIIVQEPEDTMVRVGEEAIFSCEIQNDPQLEPDVYWMKGSERLDGEETLTVPDTQLTDSGTYTCVVETDVDGNIHIVNSSAELSVQGPPSRPENLDVRVPESGLHYTLQWDASIPNNSPVLRYIIKYDTPFPDKSFEKEVQVREGTTRYEERIELDPYIEYTFQVVAVNEIGESEPSQDFALADRTAPANPLKNPENVMSNSDRPENIAIRWDPVEEYYFGGPNFKYVVFYKRQNETAWKNRTLGSNIRHLLLSASKPYEAFDVKVQSKNDEGFGPVPMPIVAHSGEALPSVAPSGVNVEVLSANEVNVTWKPIPEEDANGNLLGYYVFYSISIGSGKEKQQCEISPCVVGNLQAATDYEITVAGFNGAGQSPESDPFFVTTKAAPPGPVKNLKIETFSYRIVLVWKEPILTNGELNGYNISIANMTDEKEGPVQFITRSPSETTLQYDAQPETKYRIKVAAYNSEGNGDAAPEEYTTKNRGPPSKPPAPMLVSGTDHVNVTWHVENLNPTAEFVEVQYKEEGESEYKKLEKSDTFSGTNETMVSELDHSTQYTVRLHVTNAAGGTFSDTSGIKTTGPAEQKNPGFEFGTWLIILICIIILLILILLIICIIKSQKGGKYNVSDKEKQLNKDIESTPLKDDGGFDEYKPPTGPDGEPLRGSQGSLNDSEHGSSETDSLKEYADGETGKFDEEGSFIGQYGDNKKQRQPDEEQGGGAAYSTFV